MAEAQTTPTEPVNPNERISKVFDALWHDKDVGAAVRRKAKEMYSDVLLPEEQLEPALHPIRAQLEATAAELKTMREEREAERKATEEASMKLNLEQAIESARTKYSLTDEGFDKMVSRMKETSNYTDADAAAAWVAQQTPVNPVAKADWLPRKANFLGSAEENPNEKFKLLHTNHDRYLDAELSEFVADPDRYVAETFGG